MADDEHLIERHTSGEQVFQGRLLDAMAQGKAPASVPETNKA